MAVAYGRLGFELSHYCDRCIGFLYAVDGTSMSTGKSCKNWEELSWTTCMWARARGTIPKPSHAVESHSLFSHTLKQTQYYEFWTLNKVQVK